MNFFTNAINLLPFFGLDSYAADGTTPNTMNVSDAKSGAWTLAVVSALVTFWQRMRLERVLLSAG